jgi:hypothetical protein
VTHVAFAGIREEPTLWQLGQAAGTAAAVALRHGSGIALQDVDAAELQRELLAQGTFVHWPPRDNCSAPLPPAPAPPAPPAPPGPPVHEKCEASKVSSITVQGAGTSAANGAYKKTEGASDGEPIFALDSGHELYRYGGRWRLGEQGHGLTYESLTANADGPPASKGWAVAAQGTAPTPVFSC